MKKLLTLVFCLGTLSSVIAQSTQDRNYRNPGFNDRRDGYETRNDNSHRRYEDAYKFSTHERDALVMHINREYNDKIQSVHRKWLMNSRDKKRLISSLENERSIKISSVYKRFSDTRNRYYDGYSYNNRRN